MWGILSIIVLYIASLQSQKPPEYDPVDPVSLAVEVLEFRAVGLGVLLFVVLVGSSLGFGRV